MTQIESFSLQAYKYVLASDFLNPSNCVLKKVEATSSIQEAIGKNLDLFDRSEKTDPAHKRGKPLRFLARSAAVIAIGIIISPAGTVWNAGGMVTSTITLVYHKIAPAEGVDIDADWKKVEGYTKGFFNDLFMATLVYIALACACGIPLVSGDIAAQAGCLLMAAMPSLAMNISPHSITVMLTFRQERAALYKAIALRNDFGIVGQNGGLLPYDTDKDQESVEMDGHLGKLCMAQGYKILRQIRDENLRRLPQEQLRFETTRTSAGESLDISFLSLYDAQFLKNREDLKRIKKLLGECLNVKADMIFSNRKVEYIMPEFPINPEIARSFFDGSDPWTLFLNRTIEKLLPDDHSDVNYMNFKRGVRARLSPHQLLEVSENANKDEIERAYRTKSMAIHPDRVSRFPSLNAEATALFQCLEEAKRQALEFV